MDVGLVLNTQNSNSYALAAGAADGAFANSSQFFRDEIRVAELAAELGFESLWCVEHHFTPNGETPSPLQTLTYFAGRTPSLNVGTCVVVLPWNDPVRVAEQIAVLDNLLAPGSKLTVGVGRGSAQPEFDGFEVPLGESSDRFRENWEIVKLLLTQENATYEGKWRTVRNMTTLPRPKSRDLLDRFYYSWGSKTSLRFAAEEGFAPLFVPKGTKESSAADMQEFNRIRAEKGWGPVRPIVTLNIFCDEDPVKAREEGRKYLREFYSNTLDHYQRLDADHFRKAGNYQETAQIAEAMARRDRDELLDDLASTQITGTPDEVLEQVAQWRDVMKPEQLLFALRFGGMSYEVAEGSVRAVSKILKDIEKWPVPDFD